MPDETLLLLTNDVRGKTLRLLDGVSDDMSRFAPPGLNNTILWHAGHALVVVEHLALMSATGKPAAYPPGWFDTFSWKSAPATVKTWPALSEVVSALRDQLERLKSTINGLSDQQLAAIPAVDPPRNRTLRYSIMHGLHDEAGHQGEIWLLRKLCSVRTAAATSTGS
jgi:hypothetical protein